MRPEPIDASRADLMRRVGRRATEPENAVAAALRAASVGYRRNVRGLPGTPDFANRRAGWSIFVHGCFWHRHEGCRKTTTPKHNAAFWTEKFRANVDRDARKDEALRSMGFRILTVWECQTKDRLELQQILSEFLESGGVERR